MHLQHKHRPALPKPEKRQQDDTITAGSTAKQARTATQTARERPTTEEPPPTRRRVNNITLTTKKGDKIRTASSEDATEQANVDKISSKIPSSATTKVLMRTSSKQECKGD